jgi:hypothetical protein
MSEIATRYCVITPNGTRIVTSTALERVPGFSFLRELIEPLLGGADMEHVSVWADFDGGTKYKALDMFVDEDGLRKGLSRNVIATEHYRRANLMGKTTIPKVADPELLNFIVGPALLFDRRVWF